MLCRLNSSIDRDASLTIPRVTFMAYQRVAVRDSYHVDSDEAEVLPVLFSAEGL